MHGECLLAIYNRFGRIVCIMVLTICSNLALQLACMHMAKFMSQDKRQVAAFVHLCWLLRCNPDVPLHTLHDTALNLMWKLSLRTFCMCDFLILSMIQPDLVS